MEARAPQPQEDLEVEVRDGLYLIFKRENGRKRLVEGIHDWMDVCGDDYEDMKKEIRRVVSYLELIKERTGCPVPLVIYAYLCDDEEPTDPWYYIECNKDEGITVRPSWAPP